MDELHQIEKELQAHKLKLVIHQPEGAPPGVWSAVAMPSAPVGTATFATGTTEIDAARALLAAVQERQS